MELAFDQDRQPLAARLRPRRLEDFVGQEHILGPGRLLRRAIEADQLSSLIFSGPPGTGKTTLARVIAERTRGQFLSVNAVLGGVKELRQAIDQARAFRSSTNRRTILFVDEVHRWNRAQQDAMLPWVEDGLIVMIGATTENPFFEVNRALLSRSRVFMLESLSSEHLQQIINRALSDVNDGYGRWKVSMTDEARDHLITSSAGDARTLLNAIELAVETSVPIFPPAPGTDITVDLSVAEESIQQRAILYDKDGDYHFDAISAFIKAIRGSDPDAALYWLARMIRAGESPHYIFRRLLIQAAEDVGLADPQAITVVGSCAQAFDRVGLPEGQFHLAQATLYLAGTEKSNSTLAYFDALAAVEEAANDDVPIHLRDGSRDGAALGHGEGYLYPHAYRDHWVLQQYLPLSLRGRSFYQPGELGWEGTRRAVLLERRRMQMAASLEADAPEVGVLAPGVASADWTRRAEGNLREELEQLRDLVLDALRPGRSDRILLSGSLVAPLVWEAIRRTPGGVVGVRAPQQVIDVLTAGVPADADPLETPQVSRADSPLADAPGTPDADFHPGPWDRVLVREIDYPDPDGLLARVRAELSADGRGLVVDTDPLGGTRLSNALELPDELRAALAAAELRAFGDRHARWKRDVPGTLRSTHPMRLHRRLDGPTMAGWLGPSTALGAALDATSEVQLAAEARRRISATPRHEVPWTREMVLLVVESAEA